MALCVCICYIEHKDEINYTDQYLELLNEFSYATFTRKGQDDSRIVVVKGYWKAKLTRCHSAQKEFLLGIFFIIEWKLHTYFSSSGNIGSFPAHFL